MAYSDLVFDIEQEQIQRNDEYRQEWMISAQTDAHQGLPPQFSDDEYLAAYCQAVKAITLNRDGTVNYIGTVAMFEYGSGDEVLRGVSPFHDCNWAYCDDEPF